jgi:hypothetical protein
MIGRLQFWRMLGAMAVLAVLSLAPQPASAHAGHSHGRAATVSQQAAPPVHDAASQAEHEIVTQQLTEADPAAPCADHGCGDRGCCSSGPCTGCHGFVVPPTLSSIVRLDDPPPHLGAGGIKLRRPPKSFV